MALKDFAGAIGSVVDGVFGIGRAKKNREHDREMQDRQFQNQQKLNQQGYDLSKRMWEETNYSAQKEQMEKAGLNAGLLYGMSGGGGATAQVSGGGSASAGHSTPSDAGKGMGMLAQQALLMKAQKENIEADTENKLAEAENKRGIEREESKARIADLTQGISNKQAQEKLTNVQTTLDNIKVYEANKSQQDRMDYIKWGAEKAYQEFISATNEAYIGVNTRNQVIEQIKAESVGAIINNMLKQKQIEVSDAQITKMANDIAQGWKDLDIKDESNAINVFKAEIEKAYPSLWQTMGRMANDAISATWKLGGKERPRYEEYGK